MKIGIDFDDVLIDFCSHMVAYYNAIDKTDFKFSDIKDFRLYGMWGLEFDKAQEKVINFYSIANTLDIKPIEGAVLGIQELAKENELVVITGRPENTKEFMVNWLDKYFPGVFKDIYFTSHFHNKGKKTKAEICSENEIGIMVDDYLGFFEDAKTEDLRIILLDKPWNQKALTKNVERVFSWSEIVAKLK